jgi:hypothetical protein
LLLSIDLYSICWNEEKMLPYFFRHYDPLVDRYVLYDDGSTDATLDILSRHPKVEVRRFVRAVADSYVLSALALHETMWKESRARADWVIVTAVDEHLHLPDLTAYLDLQKRNGVTAIPALGYQMLAREFPQGENLLTRICTTGASCAFMNKLSIFDPGALDDTGYEVGRHKASPTGDVYYPANDELLNLHFKYIGLNYAHERHQLLKSGLGATDNANRWGHRYNCSFDELHEDFLSYERRAIDISMSSVNHDCQHNEPRWWRSPNDLVTSSNIEEQ